MVILTVFARCLIAHVEEGTCQGPDSATFAGLPRLFFVVSEFSRLLGKRRHVSHSLQETVVMATVGFQHPGWICKSRVFCEATRALSLNRSDRQ